METFNVLGSLCVACLSTDRPNDRLCPLHASAPDLLAALSACCDAIEDEVSAAGDDEHPTIAAHAAAAERGRAAIRKAKGEAT